MKRNVYLAMKGLAEARSIFLNEWQNKHTDSEEIKVEEALGRVTAAPVYAEVSAPAYHSAAMDGIAVRAEETYQASDANPQILKTGDQAVMINTGQALPKGYNAVIMVEKIHIIDESRIEILSPAYPWQNIRKVGEDIIATQLLFPQNYLIRAYDLGALIAAGVFRIMVRKKPKAIIIPTGTEIISHKEAHDFEQLKTGKILDSNSVTLAGLICEARALPHVFDIVPDEKNAIRAALLEAANSDADLILIIAGSSAGAKDYTAVVLSQIGKVFVHGVSIMPGKPTILGALGNKPVVGIPGYTVSAIISFEQFAKPLLFSLQGLPDTPAQSITVRPSRNIPSKLGIEEFVRVNIGRVGKHLVATALPRAAGSVTTLTRAEGIIRIPPSTEGIAQDETIDAELLVSSEELDNTIVFIGSHDIAIDILADEIRRSTGKNLRISSGNVGSLGGLLAIRNGMCHFAGAHLLDTQTGVYNIPYIRQYLKGIKICLFRLVIRQQGLIIQKNNPKKIRELMDVARNDVTFVNRQAGSGTRILFDYNIGRAGISSQSINGYDHEEFSHMSVAVDVLSGTADCGMGIYAAAKALGLDFVAMDNEQYDIIIPAAFLENPNIQTMLETIGSKSFRERVAALGGYDPSESGKLLLAT